MVTDSVRLRASLAKDPMQFLLFAATIGEIGYKSGRGPCPAGDQIIILAKDAK